MAIEILIVDDNADIRNILNELILDAGYKTRLAANFNQALAEIDKKIPDVAILDPDLTIGLPAHTTAATGIDAMVHAIEGYASANKNNNPISKMLSIEALKLLGGSIEKAVFDGSNIEARGNMLIGAMLAGKSFANSPVAAVHALAYPIGGTFHVSHGLSNSLVLPYVLRFNSADNKDPI